MILGKKIAMYRKLRNLTQNDLANAVGVRREYIAKIERGKKKPGINVLARIAYVLRINIHEFFNE